jgi:peptidoglycan-associated lipoprotein
LVDVTKYKGKPGDTVKVYAEVVLDMIPISTGTTTAEIRLENIYYDYNSAALRPESWPELDKLVNLLNENPGMTIQINSHTDSRGNDKYNIKLSAGRAQSVVDYLINKGIKAERLTSKGYGESSPSVLSKDLTLPSGKIAPKGTVLTESYINTFKSDKMDFEFLHQLNRRTTFTVTGMINLESEDAGDIRIDQAD